jgi:hypothetical protein
MSHPPNGKRLIIRRTDCHAAGIAFDKRSFRTIRSAQQVAIFEDRINMGKWGPTRLRYKQRNQLRGSAELELNHEPP